MASSDRPVCLSLVLAGALACAAIACLTACQPSHPAAKDPAAADAAALEAQGYTHAPVVTAVKPGEAGFVVIDGAAPADSRMRFAFADPLKGGTQGVGVTTDGQGHFSAEVPVSSVGGLYDITADDGGRLRQMEGRMFVPPGRPDRTVLLRPGLASQSMTPQAKGIWVADYDAAGAFALSGRVAPNAAVTVIVNNEVRAEVHSDAQGLFNAATQVPPPTASAQTVSVIVQAAGESFRRDVQVVAGPTPFVDHMAAAPDGWQVDWQVPGGGGQSTVVFK